MLQATSVSQTHHATPGRPVEPVRDISGYQIFSSGDTGAAHTMAHRMFDENRIERGHRLLGDWLAGRTGSGSDWVHLQFHMAVFELAIGDWGAAYHRFQDQILPSVSTTMDALTDAPALLWRLKLSAPDDVELSWDAVHSTALECMQRPCEPFVELHNLLALAGAGDVDNLERWINTQPQKVGTHRLRLVRRMAIALVAYVTGRYHLAIEILANLIPRFKEVGGSRAQNQLFHQLMLSCRHRLDEDRLTA